jgi:hypothetical protein
MLDRSKRQLQMGNLLARQLDHESVLILRRLPTPTHVFAGALKQFS